MTVQHLDKAEAIAKRAWAWLVQVQRDRSLPVSALRTATVISHELLAGADLVDVAHMRSYLADRGCALDRDVAALVRGRHLTWRIVGEDRARSVMQFRRSGRRGGRT